MWLRTRSGRLERSRLSSPRGNRPGRRWDVLRGKRPEFRAWRVRACLGLFVALVAIVCLFGLAGAPRAADNAAPTPSLPPGAETCTECHEVGRPSANREPGAAPKIDAAAILASPHAGVACTDCHADLAGAEFPHPEKLKPVDCGQCHDDEQTQYNESLHGQAAHRGDKDAPTCKECHGTHDILRPSDPNAPTTVMNIPTLCGRCHHEGSED